MADSSTTAIPLSTGKTGGKRGLDGWLFVAIPGVAFVVVCFGLPLLEIFIRSFTDPSPAVTYGIFWQVPIYAQTLLRTFLIAGLAALATLLLGYPFAYVMAKCGSRVRSVLLALVLLSIGTSFLVRTFALQILLQDTGVINSALLGLGIISEPLPLIRSLFGVTLGMAQILLPFMVLPLFNTMTKIDPELVRAASSLGAGRFRAFLRVFLPLSVPGISAGVLLVFVLSLGFYIVPAMLGGPQSTMISTLIVNEVQLKSEFGTASAIAVTLLAVTLVVLAVSSRFVKIGSVFGGGLR